MSRFSGTKAKNGIKIAALTAVTAFGIVGGPMVTSASAAIVCGPSNFAARLTGSTTRYVCAGQTVTLGASDSYTLLTIETSDRVWLHQTASGTTGWADCGEVTGASPTHQAFISLSGRDTSPGNIQVTNNTTPCSGIQ